MPAMTSRTRGCAPKPIAMPRTPAPATNGPKERDEQRRNRQTDFDALQILGPIDRLRLHGDLPETMVERLVQAMQANLFRDIAAIFAEIAIHRFPGGIVIGEGKTDAENRRRWALLRQDIERHSVD